MKKELVKILKIAFIILIPLVIIYFLLIFFLTSPPEQKCENMDLLIGLKYDACYNYNSNTILLEAAKYSREKGEVITAAVSDREFVLSELPDYGENKNYQFAVDKNPFSIKIYQFLRKNENLCNNTKIIELQNCSEEKVNVSIDLSYGNQTLNLTKPPVSNKTSDLINPQTIDKSRIFNLPCKSNWLCSDWEECINNIQKRICIDKNSCLISTEFPEIERQCTKTCKESWQCEWSECINGFSTPVCYDRFNCGTEYLKPEKVSCDVSGCIPDLICGEWGQCIPNYNFIDINSGVQKIEGIRKRICSDNNKCFPNYFETQACSIRISIYSKEAIICNKSYIEVYDFNTNQLLARIRNDKNNQIPDISISLDQETEECDSCLNNILDGDETSIDCGGSCQPCVSEKYEQDFLSDISEWLRNLFRV
jgi:hypothetical protein